MQKIVPTTLLLLFLCSCASAPPPSDKLAPARYAVAKAYAMGASDLAREDYLRAKAKLEEGLRLNRQGDPGKADLVLKQAIFFARRARDVSRKAWEADVVQVKDAAAEKIEPTHGGDEFGVKILGAETDSARREKPVVARPRQQDEPQRLEPARAALDDSPEPTPDPPLPGTYVVRDGETLWSISARRSIYRDALLWPLIYKANRDQIKDPRQIFPEQVLSIPRRVSDEEMDEAREKARRSEIFPVEVLLRQIVGDEK